MKMLMTKERPINENTLKKSHERVHDAIEAAAAGEPTIPSLADNTGDQLLRVLIIDDHCATARTLSSLVAIWGHDFRTAYDGVTGLALAAAFRPDVLLLDMLMPNLTGFEVAVQVRRQDRLQHCFIVAVTGRTDAKHRNRCYAAGADLYLMKPVAPSDMQTLLSLEAEHVRQRRSRITIGTAGSKFAASF